MNGNYIPGCDGYTQASEIPSLAKYLKKGIEKRDSLLEMPVDSDPIPAVLPGIPDLPRDTVGLRTDQEPDLNSITERLKVQEDPELNGYTEELTGGVTPDLPSVPDGLAAPDTPELDLRRDTLNQREEPDLDNTSDSLKSGPDPDLENDSIRIKSAEDLELVKDRDSIEGLDAPDLIDSAEIIKSQGTPELSRERDTLKSGKTPELGKTKDTIKTPGTPELDNTKDQLRGQRNPDLDNTKDTIEDSSRDLALGTTAEGLASPQTPELEEGSELLLAQAEPELDSYQDKQEVHPDSELVEESLVLGVKPDPELDTTSNSLPGTLLEPGLMEDRVGLEVPGDPELIGDSDSLEVQEDPELENSQVKLKGALSPDLEESNIELETFGVDPELENGRVGLKDNDTPDLINSCSELTGQKDPDLNTSFDGLTGGSEIELINSRTELGVADTPDLKVYREGLNGPGEVELGTDRVKLEDSREAELEDSRIGLGVEGDPELSGYSVVIEDPREDIELSGTIDQMVSGENPELGTDSVSLESPETPELSEQKDDIIGVDINSLLQRTLHLTGRETPELSGTIIGLGGTAEDPELGTGFSGGTLVGNDQELPREMYTLEDGRELEPGDTRLDIEGRDVDPYWYRKDLTDRNHPDPIEYQSEVKDRLHEEDHSKTSSLSIPWTSDLGEIELSKYQEKLGPSYATKTPPVGGHVLELETRTSDKAAEEAFNTKKIDELDPENYIIPKETKPVGLIDTVKDRDIDDAMESSEDQITGGWKKGKLAIPAYKLGGDFLSYLNPSKYLRFVAENTVGAIPIKGSYKRELLNKTLEALIEARTEMEERAGLQLWRLPGDDEYMKHTERVLTSGNGISNQEINRLNSTIQNYLHLDTVISQPVNRPVEMEDGSGYKQRLDAFESIEGPNPNSYWPTDGGWNSYNRHSSDWGLDKDLNVVYKGAAKDLVRNKGLLSPQPLNSYLNTGLGQEGEKILEHHPVGLFGTISNLCEVKDPGSLQLKTFEDLRATLEKSPYLTTADTLYGIRSNGIHRHDKVMTLDSNHVWEIVLEPYLGVENGYVSYLPSIQQINYENYYNFGLDTNWNKWFPFTGFELTTKKMVQKSISLYAGEISVPQNMEFVNELRMTICDDQFKSWKRYFEYVMYSSVYYTEPRKSGYYDRRFLKDMTLGVKENVNEKDNFTSKDLMTYFMTNLRPAPYKNVTFRCRIYSMNPQYQTIHCSDLLVILKDFTEEWQGEVDASPTELSLMFSVVGENPIQFPKEDINAKPENEKPVSTENKGNGSPNKDNTVEHNSRAYKAEQEMIGG